MATLAFEHDLAHSALGAARGQAKILLQTVYMETATRCRFEPAPRATERKRHFSGLFSFYRPESAAKLGSVHVPLEAFVIGRYFSSAYLCVMIGIFDFHQRWVAQHFRQMT